MSRNRGEPRVDAVVWAGAEGHTCGRQRAAEPGAKYHGLGRARNPGLAIPRDPDGATDGEVFRIFVHQVLCPVLAHGDIVVMDNVRAHKVEGSGKQLKAVGVSSSTYRRIRPISR